MCKEGQLVCTRFCVRVCVQACLCPCASVLRVQEHDIVRMCCICARVCAHVLVWTCGPHTQVPVCVHVLQHVLCAPVGCPCVCTRVHACALSMDECAQRIRTRMLEHVCAHTRAHVCVGQDWGHHRPCSPGRPPGGGGALAGGWTAGAALGGWWHQAEAGAPRGLPDDQGRAGPRARSPRLLCSPVPARAPAATRLGGPVLPGPGRVSPGASPSSVSPPEQRHGVG